MVSSIGILSREGKLFGVKGYIYIWKMLDLQHTHTYIFDVEKSLQGDHFMYPPLLSKLWIVQNYPPHGSINSLASPADMAWPQ
jgi:hypothetical protein